MSKYGEPLRFEYLPGDKLVLSKDGSVVAAVYTSQEGDRIVACVNALAGVADPAAALRAAREALRDAAETLDMCVDEQYDKDSGEVSTADACRAALAALGGKAKL